MSKKQKENNSYKFVLNILGWVSFHNNFMSYLRGFLFH